MDKMRRVGTSVGLVCLLTGLASACGVFGQAATCPTTLHYGGVTYIPLEVDAPIAGIRQAGEGIVRGCGDRGQWKDTADVFAVASVDPSLAVVLSAYDESKLYVARGITLDELTPSLAGHVTEQ